MRVPLILAEAFGAPFEKLISEFAVEKGLIPDAESIENSRFLARAVIPHVKKLSALFNRIDRRPEKGSAKAAIQDGEPEQDQSAGLDPYWKQSSNPTHLRMAYFLYFMPSNLFRVASIWSELARLGYKWKASDRIRGIEFGSGPAAGATGVAAGEKYTPVGLPHVGDWALIEQDRAALRLGSDWALRFFQNLELPDWGTRTFHRTLDIKQGFLPPTAPKFNVWVMSFFLNEILGEKASPDEVANALLDSWTKHLENEAIIILVEPALKLQSRKLLELRKSLLRIATEREFTDLKLLLPCLGEQNCGALSDPEDWCHEEVTWWRPPYFKKIDQMAGLDRKSLPFSYLVFAKSARSRSEILPELGNFDPMKTQRLVSPSHSEGRELEFYVCGQDGKRKTRYRPTVEEAVEKNDAIQRGDVLLGTSIRGDVNASRIESFKKKG